MLVVPWLAVCLEEVFLESWTADEPWKRELFFGTSTVANSLSTSLLVGTQKGNHILVMMVIPQLLAVVSEMRLYKKITAGTDWNPQIKSRSLGFNSLEEELITGWINLGSTADGCLFESKLLYKGWNLRNLSTSPVFYNWFCVDKCGLRNEGICNGIENPEPNKRTK